MKFGVRQNKWAWEARKENKAGLGAGEERVLTREAWAVRGDSR